MAVSIEMAGARVKMLHSRIPGPSIRRGIFHSFRFQLATVLFTGVFLPVLIVMGMPSAAALSIAPIRNSTILVTLAAIGLVCSIRRLGLYPGAGVEKYIIPTLAILYALVLGTIAIFRLEYSNTILVLSFLGTLLARYGIASINTRGPQLLHAIVPGGRVGIVAGLPGLIALKLERPELVPLSRTVIIADLHHNHSPEWERFIAESAISGIPVYHYKQLWEAITGRVQMEHLSENSFGALIPGNGYRKVKRLTDFVLCLILLPFILPVMAITAVLIKLDSPGPALFRQERMGYRGRTFMVCKFRTMKSVNDGQDREASMTMPDDQRITRLGAFLRQTRIDELPQIWNVLRGEMSWIGPRPEAVSLSKWYEGELPFYRYRHIVRPGISGWAQVNQGHVCSLEEVDHKLQFDFYYIKNISYWIDTLILFRTIGVVLSGFGAR